MTETQFAVEMKEAIYNFIELQVAAGEDFTIKAFAKHLMDSYDH